MSPNFPYKLRYLRRDSVEVTLKTDDCEVKLIKISMQVWRDEEDRQKGLEKMGVHGECYVHDWEV